MARDLCLQETLFALGILQFAFMLLPFIPLMLYLRTEVLNSPFLQFRFYLAFPKHASYSAFLLQKLFALIFLQNY